MLRCGGSEAGQTYDEVVTSPQKPTDPAIPVEALYDEILSLREQVARMEAGGAFALQDELDRLRRRLDTADGDLGAPLPPPEDAPLEYEEIGGRDSAPTLSAADRESAAARLSRGGPRQRPPRERQRRRQRVLRGRESVAGGKGALLLRGARPRGPSARARASRRATGPARTARRAPASGPAPSTSSPAFVLSAVFA